MIPVFSQLHRPPLQRVQPLSRSVLLDKAIFAGLPAALVFTALAHGAVEPWSVALFELMVIAVLLLWGIKTTLDQHLEITVPAAALPIVALLLLGIAQSVALAINSSR